MAERIAVSKKTRFEIFKRDRFTCQYCGRKSPDVILEVDHITPVAEGGTNEMINLITSCRDCNRGKGKTTLSDETAVAKQQEQLEELQERREQMRMMVEWRKELVSIQNEMVSAIEDIILAQTGAELTDMERIQIRDVIRRFGFEETAEAVEIAMQKYYNGRGYSIKTALKKIGGICYNRKIGRKADYYAE